MQQTLDINLTEFIRHYLTRDGVEIKKDEVYFQIKERMIKRDAIDYLKDLYEFSEYYAKLLDPLKENNLKIIIHSFKFLRDPLMLAEQIYY